MDVAFKTLGCKLNYSETSSISRDFENKGYNKVSFEDVADIYVINTCSVTQNADKEFKYLVNKVKRINPNSKVVAIGCYAQLKPKEISSFKGVDLVLGADKKFNIIDYLDSSSHHSCEINSVNYFKSSYSLGDRTRSFLKVQDGCDYKCTYCTIPLARGKSRSGAVNEIIENAKTLVDNGIKEIVLTGVNIGDYGIFENRGRQTNFLTLLKEIEKIKNLDRVRISSIEPNLLNNDIIEFVSQSQKIMPHFHIPLQSGSDKILKLMKRRYLSELYVDRVNKIKELIPDCCIGADVIVGFPGENDIDFTGYVMASLDWYVYFAEKNSKKIKSERSSILRELSDIKRESFYKKNINSERKILFESENKNGFIHGYTDNYIRVKTIWSSNLVDSIVKRKLFSISNDNLVVV